MQQHTEYRQLKSEIRMETEKISKKLLLAKSTKRLIINAPEQFKQAFKDEVITWDKGTEKEYDFMMLFSTEAAQMKAELEKIVALGQHDGLFWVCYPKGTGDIKSDIKRETVGKTAALFGLKPVTQIALNTTWSAMRVRPLEMVGR